MGIFMVVLVKVKIEKNGTPKLSMVTHKSF